MTVTKERLTKENIREDLLKALGSRASSVSDQRFSYMIPITAIAVILWVVFQQIWLGLAVFSVAAYHIVRFAVELQNDTKIKKILKNAIGRGEFSVSVEKLCRIETETIYEPHRGSLSTRTAKTVKIFYFLSGANWRVPAVGKHYQWSKTYDMSSDGLDNTSITDDEFYFVKLQADQEIGYIYNTKFFEFRENA